MTSGPRPMMTGPAGGPRPMVPGGVQTRPPAPSHMMGGGSGGSATEASAQEVIVSLNNLFDVYSKVEPNAKMRQQTEVVYNMLKDRIQEGSITPHVLSMLHPMLQAAEHNNFVSAQNIHKDMI